MLKVCGTAGPFSGNHLAAAAENARMNRENIERQLADELEGRMQPYRARQAAAAADERRIPGGLQVSAPGEAEPSWMQALSRGEGE
jgi:hypothetical protein